MKNKLKFLGILLVVMFIASMFPIGVLAASASKPCGATEPGSIKTGAIGASGNYQTGYTSSSYVKESVKWTYKGVKYMTVFTPTGTRYLKPVRKLGDWYVASPGLVVTVEETKTYTDTVSNLVSKSFSGGINADLFFLSGTLNSSQNKTTAISLTIKKTQKFNYGDYNIGNRYCYYSFVWFNEYNTVTYKYNSSTKSYSTKVNTLGSRKVSGKYYKVGSNPIHLQMWGYGTR